MVDAYQVHAHHAVLHVAGTSYAVESVATTPIQMTPNGIAIESTKLVIESYDDEAEIRMLTAVGRGEDEMRLVYADWLEERMQHARAELLRIQLALLDHAPGSPEAVALAERIFALRTRVPPAWASLVARPAIDIGDDRLAFRIGPPRGDRKIWDVAMFQLCVGGTPVTPVAEPAVDDLLQTLGALGRPLADLSFDGGVVARVARLGEESVVTFGSRDHEHTIVTRLPHAELRARIDRVREIVLA